MVGDTLSVSRFLKLGMFLDYFIYISGKISTHLSESWQLI